MWATPARHQATTNGRIRSLSWVQCKDIKKAGWLANTDNDYIGVTWIDESEQPNSEKGIGLAQNASVYKSSFNLKDHTKEYWQIFFVRFSPQGDKLVTYGHDSYGQAKLWFNESNAFAVYYMIIIEQKVRDMQWSPSGEYIAVCGDKIEILSGTDFQHLTVHNADDYFNEYVISCAWNDSSTQLAFGSSHGRVAVIDQSHDVDRARAIFIEDVPIRSLHYYGPTRNTQVYSSRWEQNVTIESQFVSAYLKNGDVVFGILVRDNSYATRVKTHLIWGLAEWSTDRTVLAVVGYYRNSPRILSAKFLNQKGDIKISVNRVLQIPQQVQQPMTSFHSMCWGLSDSIIFLGCKNYLYSMSVQHSMPRLQDLCRQFLKTTLSNHQLAATNIPLPEREIEKLRHNYLVHMPFDVSRRDAVLLLNRPLENNRRLNCYLSYSTDQNGRMSYTLYCEFMGSYMRLLKADIVTSNLFKTFITIKPAFPLTSTHILPMSTAVLSSQATQVNRWKLFKQRILRLFRPSPQVMAMRIPEEEPVLAIVRGSPFTNYYEFFSDNAIVIGELNIWEYLSIGYRNYLTITDLAVRLTSSKITWNSRGMRYPSQLNILAHFFAFQYEHEEQMVLQLGRIGDDYVLEFQYPLSPVTAMCTAVSSITSFDFTDPHRL